jgi:hypothetical protein
MSDELAQIVQKVQGMAQTAAAPEVTEAGPGDVTATLNTDDGVQLVSIPTTPEQVMEWWKRIEASDARMALQFPAWDLLLDEYMPTVSKSGQAETVKNNGHFRNVHSKIGQLFYRAPDILCIPDDPGPAQNQMPNPMFNPMNPTVPPMLKMEDVVSVKQKVLKKKLGRDGIKVNRLQDQRLFDVLAWAGIGCCKVGYRCVFKPIQRPVMIPDPNALTQLQPVGSVLGLQLLLLKWCRK